MSIFENFDHKKRVNFRECETFEKLMGEFTLLLVYLGKQFFEFSLITKFPVTENADQNLYLHTSYNTDLEINFLLNEKNNSFSVRFNQNKFFFLN